MTGCPVISEAHQEAQRVATWYRKAGRRSGDRKGVLRKAIIESRVVLQGVASMTITNGKSLTLGYNVRYWRDLCSAEGGDASGVQKCRNVKCLELL